LLAKLRRCGSWILALVVCAGAGELASRTDDWLFADVPFFANPDRQHDLELHDADGVRGRPHGVYKKWKLNAYGFRGPEIDEHPASTVRRVMLLGASETFGLFESPDHEYAALLRERLAKAGHLEIEIVNAAIAGIGLPTMTHYWEQWASRFEPSVVVIYPSPHFYLDNKPPRFQPRIPEPNAWQSRFAERVVDTVKKWDVLKAIRLHLHLRRELAGKGDDYLFDGTPPADRLEAYERDLETLADAVEKKGARPVLVTHAFKTPSPPAPGDRFELEYMRIFFPRALPESLPAFDEAARKETIELGRRRGWQVIDASAVMTGHREWFGDVVHFNDAGSAKMAEILAVALQQPGCLERSNCTEANSKQPGDSGPTSPAGGR
jgi:hypothetical protein